MPRGRRTPQPTVMPAPPIYLSKTRSALNGLLMIGLMAGYLGLLFMGLSAMSNPAAHISAEASAWVFILLIGSPLAIGGLAYNAFRFFSNIYKILNGTTPQNEYKNQLQNEKIVIATLERRLNVKRDKTFAKKLNAYIKQGQEPAFESNFGDRKNFLKADEYDKLKIMKWVHKKLAKIPTMPERNRNRYEHIVLAKAEHYFKPYIIDLKAKQAADRAQRLEERKQQSAAEKAIHWKQEIRKRFRNL